MKQICTTFLLACAAALLLSACQQPARVQGFAGLAQGTSYQVRFHVQDVAVDTAQLQSAIEAELREIDRAMSNYRDDSLIEQFNRHAGKAPFAVDAELVTLLRQASAVTAASGGCYDPGIAPLRALWGFADDQLQVPQADDIRAASKASSIALIEVVDERHLRKLSDTVALDLSSIAQGYTAQRMAEILEQHGVVNYIAEIGGEMLIRGARADGSAWQVAVQHPASEADPVAWRRAISSRSYARLAIATSGSYRQQLFADGIRYSHIIDARNGRPVRHNTVSVTVQHNDGALADAWSTALLCLGREQGMAVAEAEDIAALFIVATPGDDAQTEVRYSETVSSAWRDAW